MGYRFRSSALTDPGRAREANEDAVLARDGARLWAVADGMGGLANGAWASAMLIAALDGITPPATPPAIAAALESANAVVYAAAAQARAQMGTTAVALTITPDALTCLWVGDSRLYRWRRSKLVQLTRDHSVVQDLVTRGVIRADQMDTHPMSHVLSRALGTDASVPYEVRVDHAVPGDLYLLATDGLTRVVQPQEIERALATGNPALATRRLIDRTLDLGAPDNVSVVVVAVEETTAMHPSAT
jgi:serine/threonine-protein phosphatase Stp1